MRSTRGSAVPSFGASVHLQESHSEFVTLSLVHCVRSFCTKSRGKPSRSCLEKRVSSAVRLGCPRTASHAFRKRVHEERPLSLLLVSSSRDICQGFWETKRSLSDLWSASVSPGRGTVSVAFRRCLGCVLASFEGVLFLRFFLLFFSRVPPRVTNTTATSTCVTRRKAPFEFSSRGRRSRLLSLPAKRCPSTYFSWKFGTRGNKCIDSRSETSSTSPHAHRPSNPQQLPMCVRLYLCSSFSHLGLRRRLHQRRVHADGEFASRCCRGGGGEHSLHEKQWRVLLLSTRKHSTFSSATKTHAFVSEVPRFVSLSHVRIARLRIFSRSKELQNNVQSSHTFVAVLVS